jgi:ubiquinone/menaquinone biosynthesis C-methylase UbiE
MDSAAAGAAPATYDRIGAGYRQVRVPDPRLAALIRQALGEPRSVVDVGAGTGSYEPDHVPVTAVDPSQVMLDQHPGADKVRAGAEDLPFADGAFDAAMAVMTVHHWPDLHGGLAELRRVARRQVVSPGTRRTRGSCAEMFLDPVLRQASATFALLPRAVVEPAMARLRADLASGAWHRRHADLLEQDSVDYGYRLLIADSPA